MAAIKANCLDDSREAMFFLYRNHYRDATEAPLLTAAEAFLVDGEEVSI
ncbi:MAG: hypothetical protein HZB35_02025 [Nitrospirae bacterium]|nr:hypothetical protein [Nitrospirota bacterium]